MPAPKRRWPFCAPGPDGWSSSCECRHAAWGGEDQPDTRARARGMALQNRSAVLLKPHARPRDSRRRPTLPAIGSGGPIAAGVSEGAHLADGDERPGES